MSCNIIVPEVGNDPCNGCQTKTECVTVDNDLTYLGITEETDLKTFITTLLLKIEELENQVNNV